MDYEDPMLNLEEEEDEEGIVVDDEDEEDEEEEGYSPFEEMGM